MCFEYWRRLGPIRLIFAARRPMPDYLALHRLADLFLDTWPYNAGAIASDALWMGLPLLTRSGATYASRMAGSAARRGPARLRDILPEQYEAEALRLARDEFALSALRTKLEGAGDASPLFDTDRYARNLEMAYEEMWRNAVSGKSSRSKVRLNRFPATRPLHESGVAGRSLGWLKP